MYSGEYDACDVTLSVYPYWASLKNMPDHSGNRTYDLWNTSPIGLATKRNRRYNSLMLHQKDLHLYCDQNSGMLMPGSQFVYLAKIDKKS